MQEHQISVTHRQAFDLMRKNGLEVEIIYEKQLPSYGKVGSIILVYPDNGKYQGYIHHNNALICGYSDQDLNKVCRELIKGIEEKYPQYLKQID